MAYLYGINWPAEFTQIDAELVSFRDNHLPERGGLGRYQHLKNAAELIWPTTLKWHPWTAKRFQALCDHNVNSWTGCGAAGKTWDAGLFGFLFWLADPPRTSVVLTSTTGKMVRKRIWPVIQELHASIENMDPPGNLVDSKTTLQSYKGDDKHGMFALAVREGPTSRAVSDIQGVHSERMLIVIDEATDTPEAIFEAIANLRKGCQDFRLLVIGNAASHIDPHGLVSEPKGGWGQITVDTDEWLTKGVDRWEIEPGICLHFDGTKSPNIAEGFDRWPFLFTIGDLRKAQARPGAGESIGFWKYTRGFWAPDGLCKTVMSEALIERHKGAEKLTFMSAAKRIAGLDPAFGGDNCVLRTGRIGDLPDGRMGVQLDKLFYIPIIADKEEPAHYQIMRQVRDICNDEGIEASHFGLDASGEGGGLASIFMREWGGGIHWIEFGGAASEHTVSEEDTRTAKQVYDRRVTELWFNVREFLVNNQLGGLQTEEIKQFCAREFSDEKRKLHLDEKAICKQKLGYSPDEADAVAVLIAVAKKLGVTPGGGGTIDPTLEWRQIALKADEINHDEEYQPISLDDRFAMSDL